jgi:hypothetical protein
MTTTTNRIVTATLIAGTIDIIWAAGNTALAGGQVAGMLRTVASGPFPGAGKWGMGGAALGLAVHFAIMAVMAAIFMTAHARIALVRQNPLLAGALFGVGAWLVMYGVVLATRFGVPFPSPDPIEIAKQLFAHVVLVGLVFGWVARRA